MRKAFFLKSLASIMVIILIATVSYAQVSVYNTKTGQVTGTNTFHNPIFAGPVSMPLGVIADVNNGWNSNFVSSLGATGSNFYAQSFIAHVTTISKFGVVIQEGSPEGEIILAIAADNGGIPNYAAPLYAGTLKNPGTTGAWFYETGLNIPVTVGQKYYVLLDGYNNAGATGFARIGISNTCPIPGEGIIWSNYGGVGAWDSMGSGSMPLAIYVEGTPPPVPVPFWTIALTFVAVGFGAYLAFRKKLSKQVA
jgi:hypothetical protein